MTDFVTEVKTFVVQSLCPKCNKGCAQFNGQMIPPFVQGGAPMFQHNCNNPKCRHTFPLKQQYPGNIGLPVGDVMTLEEWNARYKPVLDQAETSVDVFVKRVKRGAVNVGLKDGDAAAGGDEAAATKAG